MVGRPFGSKALVRGNLRRPSINSSKVKGATSSVGRGDGTKLGSVNNSRSVEIPVQAAGAASVIIYLNLPKRLFGTELSNASALVKDTMHRC